MKNQTRTAIVERHTRETEINLSIKLDGEGIADIETDEFFLGHMLTTFAKYSGIDIHLSCDGDHIHHLIEDVAIVLGRALREAVDNGPDIRRIAHKIVPMDDALIMAAVDMIDRPYYKGEVPMPLFNHFLRSFAHEGKFCLHTRVMEGHDEHHLTEATFKAVGFAIGEAITPREGGILSTKDRIRIRTG